MKIMTCKQLGGVCGKEFRANTFEEIAAQSKQHGMEMFASRDEAHMPAMEEMKEMMHNPEKMNQWMDSKKAEFDSLAESN